MVLIGFMETVETDMGCLSPYLLTKITDFLGCLKVILPSSPCIMLIYLITYFFAGGLGAHTGFGYIGFAVRFGPGSMISKTPFCH